MQIIPDQSGTGLLVPRSVLVSRDTVFHVQFAIRNRLQFASLDSQVCAIALLVAGPRQPPSVTRPEVETPLEKISLAASGSPGFIRQRNICAAPAVQPGLVQPVSFRLKLPEQDGKVIADPGSVILIRAELFFEGELVQYTPARSIRVCAPWPPEGPATSSDLLFFVDEKFVVEDYKLLHSLAYAMGLKACFLDYQHFAEINNGKLPASLWAPHKGKATVVWMPSLPGLAKLVPDEDFLEHIKAGGTLLCGGLSTFKLTGDAAQLKSQLFRRGVRIASQFTMTDLKKDLQIDEKKFSGDGLVNFVLAFFAALPTERKLLFLLEKGENIGQLALGNLSAHDFQTLVPASGGCCSCSSRTPAQVVPVRKSPCTIRDALVNAVRTDLMIDRHLFTMDNIIKNCIAINDLLSFASKSVLALGTKSRDQALLARDIAAVIRAANLLDETTFQGGARVIWTSTVLQLKAVTMRCESIAMEAKLDVGAAAERAKEVDIIAAMPGRSSNQTSPSKVAYMLPLL